MKENTITICKDELRSFDELMQLVDKATANGAGKVIIFNIGTLNHCSGATANQAIGEATATLDDRYYNTKE